MRCMRGPRRWMNMVGLVAYVVAAPAFAKTEGVSARSARPGGTNAYNHALPPMGWNAWNSLACDVTDQKVRAVVDTMATNGMRDAGYIYINLDDCWQKKPRAAGGKIEVDRAKFPDGLAALSRYVISKGFRFGIYSAPNDRTCANFPGSYGHEDSDAAFFRSIGASYLKYDICGGNYDGFARMRAALKRAYGDSPIYLAGNPALPPSTSLIDVPGLMQSATIAPDIGPTWASVRNNFEQIGHFAAYATPEYINNADMLEVGVGKELTPDQQRAHFSMWAMLASPLIAGNDVSRQSAETLAILTNRRVIAINQDPLVVQAVKLATHSDDAVEVWYKPLMGRGQRAILILNHSPQDRDVALKPADLVLSPGAAANDVWDAANARDDRTAGSGEISIRVKANSFRFLQLDGQDQAMPEPGDLSSHTPLYSVASKPVRSAACPGFAAYNRLPIGPTRWDAWAEQWQQISYCWWKDTQAERSSGAARGDGTAGALSRVAPRTLSGLAPVQLMYPVPERCRRFGASIAVAPTSGRRAAVLAELWGDDRKLATSAVVRTGARPVVLDQDIRGFAKVRLIVEPVVRGEAADATVNIIQPGYGCR